MSKHFWDGFTGLGKHVPRSPSDQVDFDMGARARGGQGQGSTDSVPLSDAAPFFRASFYCAVIGAVGGLGYGVWQLFTDQISPGLGENALIALKWTGIGAGAGLLLPAGLIAGLSLGLLAAILWGLGLLLNFLTSL